MPGALTGNQRVNSWCRSRVVVAPACKGALAGPGSARAARCRPRANEVRIPFGVGAGSPELRAHCVPRPRGIGLSTLGQCAHSVRWHALSAMLRLAITYRADSGAGFGSVERTVVVLRFTPPQSPTIRCRRDGPDGPRPELKRWALIRSTVKVCASSLNEHSASTASAAPA